MILRLLGRVIPIGFFLILSKGLASEVAKEPPEKVIRVEVSGLVCQYCAQGIKKKFTGEKGVKQIIISMEKHLLTLKLNSGEELSDARISELMKEAGFTVSHIHRENIQSSERLPAGSQ